MSAVWIISEDLTSATVTGRELIPWSRKINPLWWLQNDTEQTVDQAPWFLPNLPHWLRALAWAIRNPLQNFRCFVVGVQDRNYTVTGKAPVNVVQRDDISQTGWQYCVIHTRIPLPFISYSGKRFLWYAGWQFNGFFGFKFNIHA